MKHSDARYPDEIEAERERTQTPPATDPLMSGSERRPCSADYADNPQFVRMEDGHPVMHCSECETEYNTGSEGITTSDDLELCIGCQADLRHLYDEDWNLLPNA